MNTNFIKKLSLMLLTILLIASQNVISAKEIGNVWNNTTIIDVEKKVENYLEKNRPDIKIGTAEYVEYLTLQLLEDDDKILASNPEYEYIRFYASIYLSELDEVQAKNGIGDSKIFLLDGKTKNKNLASIKKELNAREKKDMELAAKASMKNNVYASSYNASNAAKYAKDWGLSSNSLYNYHFKDCTNFVSQAVEAGGMSQKYTNPVPLGITSTTSKWYSIRYEEWHGNNYVYRWKETSSWMGVGDFYTYWLNNGAVSYKYSTLSGIQNNARIGDVVQLKDENGAWYHSVMITGGTQGDLKYSAHTSNRSNYPVTNLDGVNEYRIIRF